MLNSPFPVREPAIAHRIRSAAQVGFCRVRKEARLVVSCNDDEGFDTGVAGAPGRDHWRIHGSGERRVTSNPEGGRNAVGHSRDSASRLLSVRADRPTTTHFPSSLVVPAMRSGVIIAGGRSTRFGDTDKAVAPLAGVPMTRRVADRVEPIVDELVVNCRADQQEAIDDALGGYDLPTSFALDQEPDQGPMAGIRDGLRGAEGEHAVVVACDMPFVDPEAVRYLFDRCTGTVSPPPGNDDEGKQPYDAAVPRLGDGWYQTTQAVYRPEPMAAACDAALERGDRKILAPLEELSYAVVGEEELLDHTAVSTFDNVNTQEELAAAEQRLTK